MRIARAVSGLAGGLVAGVLLPVAVVPEASAVSVDQTYDVPASRVLTVRGHGFGHGHGMSQYGAYGAARQGLTHKQIIDFYYPGTTWSTVTGKVRVLLHDDTGSDLVVGRVPGMTVRDLGTRTTYDLPSPTGVTRWRLSSDAAGRTVLAYRTTTWHRWTPTGARTLVGDAQFRAPTPLTLYAEGGTGTYRGALRAASPSAGSTDRDTVNVLSVDNYVRGVIPSEMPTSWSPEAVQAQAVAARTYATWSRAQFPTRYYQICDTSYCQVYGGHDAEDERGNAAVDATLHEILTYGGTAAFTQFSSSSGGWTSAGSVPYLTARADPYDDFSGNPVHLWTTTLSAQRIQSAYPAIGRLRSVHVTRRDGHGQWKGRVWTLVLDGAKADRTVSGDDFRATFGLRSAWFTFAR